MGLKDDVRLRRQQKIRRLLEQFNQGDESAKRQEETAVGGATGGVRDKPVSPGVQPNNDPELAWKRNPNPWSAWEEQSGSSDRSRFVKPKDAWKNDEAITPPRFAATMKWRLLAAATLFALVWGLFQIDRPWTESSRAFVRQALTDELDFAAAAVWYKEMFAGAPSFIPMFESQRQDAVNVGGSTVKQSAVSPLEGGVLLRTFAELLTGIELTGAPEARVVAVETGKVIFVGEGQDSVLIQHAESRVTIYGNLGSATVEVGDWVEAGDPIGALKRAAGENASPLYFGVKQQDQYVDPLDVIALD